MQLLILLAASILILFILGGKPAVADTLAIIGTGNVGGALGQQLAESGHTIIYGCRDPVWADPN